MIENRFSYKQLFWIISDSSLNEDQQQEHENQIMKWIEMHKKAIGFSIIAVVVVICIFLLVRGQYIVSNKINKSSKSLVIF